MCSRRTSSVPKEDVVFPRMLYCDSRCSQTFPSLSLALPGALLCNATRRLGDGQRVILRPRVRGSIRAVRGVVNTRVFQTETTVVAEEAEAASMIRLCCSPEVRCIVRGMRNPHDMWNTLDTSLDTTGSYIGRQDMLRQFRAC